MSIPRFRRPQIATIVALAAATVLLAGCDSLRPPHAITAQGREIGTLYDFVFAIAIVVFVLVEGLILFAVIRYRRKPTDTELPPQIHGNNTLEIIWTVIPTIVVAVMFILSYQTLTKVDAVDNTTDVRIRAVAARFQWTFEYLSADGLSVLFRQQAPEMEVPVGKTVHLTLESKDVTHSFYVPQFLFKRDVVPGRENVFEFTVDPVDVNQTFRGQCAQLCGTYHDSMLFSLKALSSADYDAWLQGQIAGAKATPAPVASAAPGQVVVNLAAQNIQYDQSAIEAPANQPFTIKFQNNDPSTSHNVTIKDPSGAEVFKGEIFSGVDVRIYPIPPLAAGTYTFFCTVHPSMTGTLTVK